MRQTWVHNPASLFSSSGDPGCVNFSDSQLVYYVRHMKQRRMTLYLESPWLHYSSLNLEVPG